jgi:hypothetical protein
MGILMVRNDFGIFDRLVPLFVTIESHLFMGFSIALKSAMLHLSPKRSVSFQEMAFPSPFSLVLVISILTYGWHFQVLPIENAWVTIIKNRKSYLSLVLVISILTWLAFPSYFLRLWLTCSFNFMQDI